jgi:hypothetical protein
MFGLVAQKTAGTGAAAAAAPLVLHELKSDDPDVSAFYAQLSERERVAHSIAVDKLGTSYDVTRTHGFLKWKRKQVAA